MQEPAATVACWLRCLSHALSSTGHAKSLSRLLTEHKHSNPKKRLNIRRRNRNPKTSRDSDKSFSRERLFNIPIESRRKSKRDSANTDIETRPRSPLRTVPQALFFFVIPKCRDWRGASTHSSKSKKVYGESKNIYLGKITESSSRQSKALDESGKNV